MLLTSKSIVIKKQNFDYLIVIKKQIFDYFSKVGKKNLKKTFSLQFLTYNRIICFKQMFKMSKITFS